MITDALINVLLALLEAAWSLMPPWDWTPEGGIVETFVGEATKWNEWFPVAEVFTWIGLLGGAFGAMLAFKWIKQAIDWIADVLP